MKGLMADFPPICTVVSRFSNFWNRRPWSNLCRGSACLCVCVMNIFTLSHSLQNDLLKPRTHKVSCRECWRRPVTLVVSVCSTPSALLDPSEWFLGQLNVRSLSLAVQFLKWVQKKMIYMPVASQRNITKNWRVTFLPHPGEATTVQQARKTQF